MIRRHYAESLVGLHEFFESAVCSHFPPLQQVDLVALAHGREAMSNWDVERMTKSQKGAFIYIYNKSRVKQ